MGAWGRAPRIAAFATGDHKAPCSDRVTMWAGAQLLAAPRFPALYTEGDKPFSADARIRENLPGQRTGHRRTEHCSPAPFPRACAPGKTAPSQAGEAPSLPAEGGREGLTGCGS